MRIQDIGGQPCSVAKALAEIGDAWSVLILREAFYGRRRFSDFVENLGAQKTVVSARLKQLVDVGILERVEYSTYPTRHHYQLTTKGMELAPVLLTLLEWGDRWTDDGRGRRVELIHTCGHHASAAVVCGHCGDRLEPEDLTPRIGPGFPDHLTDIFAKTGQ